VKLPAITNATLTKVEAKSLTADYDRDVVAGTVKWTGAEAVFWSETEEEVTTDSVVNVIIKRSLVIDASVSIPWDVDDIVTATHDGATVHGTVQRFVNTKADGFAGVTRVVLENG
jgi:hypothetical protein